MSKIENPPAFPVEFRNDAPNEGMTLRDYFAAAALTGIAAYPDSRVWRSDSGIPLEVWHAKNKMEDATHAYALADAMLAARAK